MLYWFIIIIIILNAVLIKVEQKEGRIRMMYSMFVCWLVIVALIVAQWIERLCVKQIVLGSNPSNSH